VAWPSPREAHRPIRATYIAGPNRSMAWPLVRTRASGIRSTTSPRKPLPAPAETRPTWWVAAGVASRVGRLDRGGL
jgi:hypothetical protein